MLLEMKGKKGKERGRDRGRCSLKGMFVVGLTGVFAGEITRAWPAPYVL